MPAVMRFAFSLLALVTVLLMPFGMSATGAATPQHGAAGMPMQHCPESDQDHGGKSGFVECTMACSAALPAVHSPAPGPPILVCLPDQPSVAHSLHGLHPETATPPPKHS